MRINPAQAGYASVSKTGIDKQSSPSLVLTIPKETNTVDTFYRYKQGYFVEARDRPNRP